MAYLVLLNASLVIATSNNLFTAEINSRRNLVENEEKNSVWVILQALTAFLIITTVVAFAFIIRPMLQSNIVMYEQYQPV